MLGGKKVLFLDIDGVVQVDTPGEISQKHLQHIKTIVDQTGCSIVLSSDWRRDASARLAVQEALKKQNLDFFSVTPPSR